MFGYTVIKTRDLAELRQKLAIAVEDAEIESDVARLLDGQLAMARDVLETVLATRCTHRSYRERLARIYRLVATYFDNSGDVC